MQKITIPRIKSITVYGKCTKNSKQQDENEQNDPNCNPEQNEITLTFSKRSTFHEILRKFHQHFSRDILNVAF